jgi:hypothetical protein
MIEFTISRVCMSICGLVLLAAVIVPVTGMYESQTVSMESDTSDSVSEMIDDFYYSKMETFVVSMTEILPSASSYLEFNGYLVTLTTERGVYKSGTNIPVIAEANTAFGYGDILKLSRTDGAVTAERLT